MRTTLRARTVRAAAATSGAALVLAMSACGQIYP
jgi:hypothetical protein